MEGYRVRPSQMGRVLRENELERQERVRRVAFEAAQEGVPIVQQRLPEDLGPLRESVHATETATGADLRVDAPYAGYIETGTRPHVVPLGVLLAWVRRHAAQLGIGSPADAHRAAVGIQQKIAREGTRPTWAVRGALKALRDGYDRVMRRRLFAPYRAR